MHSNIDHVCPPHSFWAGAAPGLNNYKNSIMTSEIPVVFILAPYKRPPKISTQEQINVCAKFQETAKFCMLATKILLLQNQTATY